jgi:hypothetical protein
MGERNELMWNLLSFVFVQGESLNKITNTEKYNEITEREMKLRNAVFCFVNKFMEKVKRFTG